MVRYAQSGRPLPEPTPLAMPFFDALRDGQLLLPHCPRDGFFFYPRSRCPGCWRADWRWQRASGRGRVHSFTVDRIGHDPALAAEVPLVIVIVELEEGPRLTANLVGCPLQDIRIGMLVQAEPAQYEGSPILQFRPAIP